VDEAEEVVDVVETRESEVVEVGPRFADQGSFEFEYGEKWKQLYEMKKQKVEALDREMKLEEDKLMAQMEYARYEHETEALRQQLQRREQEREMNKNMWEQKEMEMSRMFDMEQQRRQEEEKMMMERMQRQDETMKRRQEENNMFMQGQDSMGNNQMRGGGGMADVGMPGGMSPGMSVGMGARGGGTPARGGMGGPMGGGAFNERAFRGPRDDFGQGSSPAGMMDHERPGLLGRPGGPNTPGGRPSRFDDMDGPGAKRGRRF